MLHDTEPKHCVNREIWKLQHNDSWYLAIAKQVVSTMRINLHCGVQETYQQLDYSTYIKMQAFEHEKWLLYLDIMFDISIYALQYIFYPVSSDT